MEHRENGIRYKNYSKWDNLKNNGYDYKNNGLIQHILSHKIVESKNTALQAMLSFYEGSIIKVLNYIDYLKHFKNYQSKMK